MERRRSVAFYTFQVAKIAVVGTGYVGLTSGACFAKLGHSVTCVDVDEKKINMLLAGEIPIVEPGLDEVVKSGLDEGRLTFTLDLAASVADAEVVFLCVPTPEGDDGGADLRYVREATRAMAPHLTPGSVVVNKSTVPVGSTRVVEQQLGRSDVFVVSNPEFLREGSAVNDFLHPDRVVVGSENQEAAVRVAALYQPTGAPVLITDPPSAETIKYAANAFLATKISFVNAIAAVCEGVGADINDVVLGLGYDRRIGHEFLRPGPGWGGSCFPKDTKALIKIAQDSGYDFDLLKGVIAVNDQQIDRIVSKAAGLMKNGVRGSTIAVWGLTFKANTDDLRDSPAVKIVQQLVDGGGVVRVFDPTVLTAPESMSSADIQIANDPLSATDGADVLLVLTEWDMFKWVTASEVAMRMNGDGVLDTRNLLDRGEWLSAGMRYVGLGR